MNRKQFWKLLIICVVIFWSLQQIFFPHLRWIPLEGRNLVQEFSERGVRGDDAFKTIVQRAQELQKSQPERPYENLRDAIGTNDIVRYFPFFDAKEEAKPTTYILNRLQREAAGRIKLGLDLRGGTSILLRMGTNQASSTDTNQVSQPEDNEVALSQAIEVLRKRVDRYGVAEPIIQAQGNDRILIQLPGLSQAQMDDAKTNIQKIALLEFRLGFTPEENRKHLEEGRVPAGYQLMTTIRTAANGEKTVDRYLVKRKAELVGGIERAGVSRDTLGRAEIQFLLEPQAAKTFAKITRENKDRCLAIVLDGELQSAPTINSEIPNGSGVITGQFTDQEAFSLANILENPLKYPLSIEEERTVDPSLGKDSIASGVTASVIAAISTFVFMLVFYFASGLVANFALALNVLILMGAMSSMGATLTMPGIAGIALTIGMAVDANVLIYERMREEIAAGKSIRGVVAASYNKAFTAIFDSNLTTVIAAVILIYFGTGPVKGFGVTLTIGIAASMFTALYVTRFIYDSLLAKGWLTKVRMMPLAKFPRISFVKWGKTTCILSGVMILIGIGVGVMHGKKVLGVDFTGGTQLTMSFSQKVDEDRLRTTLDGAALGDSSFGYQKSLATGNEVLQLVVPIGADQKAQAALNEKFPEAAFKVVGTDQVGATVGAEIQESAVIASLLAMFAILIYVAFRYEFSFAIASVIALLHDVLITLGIYFLCDRQLTAPMIAGILTIIGYSINDKIVNLDRIREDLKLGVHGSFQEVIDTALNKTLSRTIITGGAVVLSTLSLLIFGGGVVNDFAFTFLVGILAGTYSSLFIASPILLWLNKGERPKIGAAQVVVEPAAAAPTA